MRTRRVGQYEKLWTQCRYFWNETQNDVNSASSYSKALALWTILYIYIYIYIYIPLAKAWIHTLKPSFCGPFKRIYIYIYIYILLGKAWIHTLKPSLCGPFKGVYIYIYIYILLGKAWIHTLKPLVCGPFKGIYVYIYILLGKAWIQLFSRHSKTTNLGERKLLIQTCYILKIDLVSHTFSAEGMVYIRK